MDGDSPVRVVFLHPRSGFHCDEKQPEIVGLEKELGTQA